MMGTLMDHPLRAPELEAFLMDQVSASIVAVDLTGTITHWNRHAERLFGYRREEAVGGNIQDLMLGPAEVRIAEEIVLAFAEGRSWDGEVTLRRKDGTPFPARTSIAPIRDDDGRIVGMVGVSQDMTEERRSAQRLAAEHAVTMVLASSSGLTDAAPRLLRAVCEGLDWQFGAVWRVDPDAGVVRCVEVWSPAPELTRGFEEITKSSAFARGVGLPGRVWETGAVAWIPDVAVDPNFPRIEGARVAEIHGAFGFPILSGDEVLGSIEFFSHDIRAPDEPLLEMMAAIGSQIGQFIEREEAERRVRESEARKTAILEAAMDCIVTMDQEGLIVNVNPAVERAFGYSPHELVGERMADRLIPPSLREQHLEAFARHLETGESTILGRRLELTGMRKDGTEFPIELTVTRVDLEGPPLFTAYVRDITERRGAEQERARLLAAERAARADAEAAQERLAFVAEASAVLSAALDVSGALERLVRLAVPRLADWCVVYLATPEGRIDRVALTHADPARSAVAERVEERFRIDPGAATGVPEVIRTGTSQLHPHATAEMLASDVDDPEGLAAILEPLAIHSWMCVPLKARGRVVGALSLVSAESRRTYDEADLSLAEDLARRVALALDNAQLYEERTFVARTLQRSLLPPEMPEIPGVEVAARYRAAVQEVEVGGDFYDVFESSGGAHLVAVGDVCGRGAEAAALTGLARHTIRAVARRERRPRRILAALNRAVLEEPSDRFCTVACGRLSRDGDHATLTVSSGGHPLPLVLRSDGSVETAGRPGTLIGVYPDPDLWDVDVELHRGDAVVLYTDGVTDDPGGDGGDGEARLAELLGEMSGAGAEAIAEAIDRTIAERGPRVRDDAAIVVLRLA